MAIAKANVERITNFEEIKQYLSAREKHENMEEELMEMLASSGALLKGHFQLESGLHSRTFFRFADVASRTDYVSRIADELIADLTSDNVKFDVILVQQSAGRILGEMLKRKLNKQLIIASADNRNRPTGELINEADFYRNDRVLIAIDLSTTGFALEKMIDIVRSRKGIPVGIVVFAVRNKKEMAKFEERKRIKVYALANLAFEEETVPESDCKLCKKSEPVLSWEV